MKGIIEPNLNKSESGISGFKTVLVIPRKRIVIKTVGIAAIAEGTISLGSSEIVHWFLFLTNLLVHVPAIIAKRVPSVG